MITQVQRRDPRADATASEGACRPAAANPSPRQAAAWWPSSTRTVAKALGAAALVLSPAGALAAADRLKGVGPGRHTLSYANSPAPNVTAPQTGSTFLVPKHAFNRTGFFPLDIQGEGIPAVIDNQHGSTTTIFDIKTNGEVVASVTETESPPICLAVKDARYANESTVWGSACTGHGNQRWNFSDAGVGRSPKFWTLSPAGRPQNSRFCLDVAHRSNTSGALVQIYPCNGGDNQKWTLISAG